MTAAEFAEWQEFDALEWIGERRADLRSANLAALVANVNRDSKRRPKPFTAIEFMPFEPQPKPDPAEVAKRLRETFGAMAAPPAPPPGD